MPLPDRYADEFTVELDEELILQYQVCLKHAKEWTDMANKVKEQIIAALGDAPAATVNGVKVVTHRPKSNYAEARIRSDYPEMTQHYMRDRVTQVFDIELFAKAHPDIAEKYRVRSFNLVEGK